MPPGHSNVLPPVVTADFSIWWIMSDLVVSVTKTFCKQWIAEGDAAGEPWTGQEWGYYIGGRKPNINPGDRLYIVAHGRIRGYAPVTRLGRSDQSDHWFDVNKITPGYQWIICRQGNAVAVTILQPIKGFQGWRYVWWDRNAEVPFENWKTEGVI